MSVQDGKNRFSRAPDLSKILESTKAKEFIKSGEAIDAPVEEKKTKTKETVKVAPPVKKKPAVKQAEEVDGMEWMTSSPNLKVQHIARIPAPLKQLIDYLGDTGKGVNQTSISVAGLTMIAEKLANERGLPLPDDWGVWLKK